MNRKISWLLAAAMSLGAGVAEAQDKVVLDVLHSYPGQDAVYNEIAANFMASHPDIEIRFRASPEHYGEGHLAIMRASIVNRLPDVFIAGISYFPDMIDQLEPRGQIVDLAPFLEKEGAGWVDENYEPAVLKVPNFEGKQYGLMYNISLPILFYNRDLVAQAGGDPDNFPTNWPDTIALAKKIDALGDDVSGISMNIDTWLDDSMYRFLVYQQGGDYVTPDGKGITFGDDGTGLKALQYARAFIAEGGQQRQSYDQATQRFYAGQIGIIYATSASIKGYLKQIGDRFELGTAAYPRDNPEATFPPGPSAAVMFTDDPAKQAAAWEYIKYITGPEAQTVVGTNTGYLPTNKRAYEDEYLGTYYTENPIFQPAIDQLPLVESKPYFKTANAVELWEAQRDIISRVMYGEVTPEEGLDQIVERTNALLAKQ